MLLRTFLFFVVVLLLGVGVDVLSQNPGELQLNWYGWQISTTAAFALIAVGVLGLLTIMLTSLYIWLTGAPKRVKRYWAYKRQEKGFLAFNDALQALALGEETSAVKAAKEAHKLLPNMPLADTLLAEVTARKAASATGKTKSLDVQREYKKFLEKPHTKVIGLRGLLAEALQNGNGKQALTYALDFYREKPKSPYVLNILTHLYARQQQVAEALFYVEKLVKQAPAKTKELEQAQFLHACLLRLHAQQLSLSGQTDDALKIAEKGVKDYPQFAPLTLQLSHLYDQIGKPEKAIKVLTKAFKEQPNLRIGRTWLGLHKNVKEATLIKKTEKFTSSWPEHIVSAILKAEALTQARHYTEARTTLEAALAKGDDRTLLQAMSELEQAQQPNSPQATKWLQKALTAPDRLQGADGQIASFELWRRQLVESPLIHLQNIQTPTTLATAMVVYEQEGA